MPKSDLSQSNVTNLRQQVFKLLDKNPLLTAKSMVKLLDFSSAQAKYYQGYLRKLKYDWKHDHIKQRGSIRSVPDDVHRAFFVGKLGVDVSRGVRERLVLPVCDWGGPAVNSVSGVWRLSKSRNRFFLFKSLLGRIRLFENGTVELYVRKPANLGKAMQLFCDAFTKTRLIMDLGVLEGFQKSLRIRGFHAAFDTEERLPYLKIPLFKGSNGIEVILGDRSNPNSVELIVNYLDQVEQARTLIDELGKAFGLMNTQTENLVGPLKNDYSR